MDQISRLDYLIQAYSNHLEKLKQNHSQNGSLMKRCETRVEELKKQKVESQWILEEIRKNVKRT
jgi:predicted  nucleic acid-binding Zn-ribbon protein